MTFFLKSKKDNIEGTVGMIAPSGTVKLDKIKIPVIDGEADLWDIVQHVRPNNTQTEDIKQWKIDNVVNINRGLNKIVKAHELEIPTFYGVLWLKKILANGEEIDYGIASLRVVTTVGAGYIVDAFQNSVELENMKFHGLGTGTTAEAVGDTALVTELTTEYDPDSTRATGTTTEASALVYRTVATNTLNGGTPAITEHGVFSASSAGVLLDRSVFSAINLNGGNGDGMQSTYDFTIAAGS